MAKRAFKANYKRTRYEFIEKAVNETLKDKELPIYVHIPFCRGICKFCPYVRFPLGDGKLISKYIEALKSEIKAYGNLMKELNIKVIDIHAGGGTPSLLPGEQFKEILETITEYFDCEAKIAIEANPEDLADENHTSELANSGVTEVSLGVQSFYNEMLKELGRRHSAEQSLQAIENLRKAGIKHVNIDMMYMIPNQSLNNWIADLQLAAQQDVDEITCYPTLITEYCLGSKFVKKGEVNQPNRRIYKQMVCITEKLLTSRGFKPVEIYGYSKKDGWKYATVNYEMEGPLLGFGCGAMGFLESYEYQNTCSLLEYIRATSNRKLPIAGGRSVTAEERAIRYATSRLFICRSLDLNEFEHKIGNFEELIGKSGFGKALALLRLLGYIKKSSRKLVLSPRGLFTAHLLCWAFVLNVPCRMCEEYLKTPWPLEVTIP
ncbi:MAG: coproporphyrinogen-III oxidase family protein [Candidatus Thermoplasmatota archaeon]